jgi:hypothetical protein
MSASQLMHSFMVTLGQRIKTLSIYEIFDDRPELSASKLALDFEVPALWEGQPSYKASLVARVSYTKGNGEEANSALITSVDILPDDVIGENREISLEAKAVSLLSPFRNFLDQKHNPKFLLIVSGDMYRSPHDRKRIWL